MNLVLRWVIILPNSMENGKESEVRYIGICGVCGFFSVWSFSVVNYILKPVFDCYIVPCLQ